MTTLSVIPAQAAIQSGWGQEALDPRLCGDGVPARRAFQ